MISVASLQLTASGAYAVQIVPDKLVFQASCLSPFRGHAPHVL